MSETEKKEKEWNGWREGKARQEVGLPLRTDK